jgi:hypothetical protein
VNAATLTVAIVAVVVAGGSLALAFRADRRAKRAERRAQLAEERAEQADEREARREQREVEEAVARRRGKPVVMQRGGSGGPTAPSVAHDYLVRNAGRATISELWLSIEDADGTTVSAYDAGGLMAVVPADAPVLMTVEVRQPLPEKLPLTLMVEWTDPDGTRTEPAGIHPRPYY